MTLIAYHGNPDLKGQILEQIAVHRAADEIVQGTYWADGRGCAVGCVLHDPDGGHARYEPEFGIPSVLAHLEDGIFEAISLDQARQWPQRFMDAIQPGADLSNVWSRFAAWMMLDETWGLINVAEVDDVKAVIVRVGEAYQRIGQGDTLTAGEEKAITDATRDTQAAWDAWAAWAARAARDAWDAQAAWDAWDARAARDAWDARAAQDAFVSASADRLIVLLSEAPVAA
jgi:hypothetical protein